MPVTSLPLFLVNTRKEVGRQPERLDRNRFIERIWQLYLKPVFDALPQGWCVARYDTDWFIGLKGGAGDVDGWVGANLLANNYQAI